jgi:hypothetical protein
VIEYLSEVKIMCALIQEVDRLNADKKSGRTMPRLRGYMSVYTTAQVAELEHCKPSTVSKWCKKNNVKRHGRDYWLSFEEVEQFQHRNKQVGKPRAK